MRFSEVILRIGTALVAWMVVFAYFLWLAVAGRVGCDAEGESLFALLLGAAPFAVLFAFLTRVSRPLKDVHGMLRWLGVGPALLSPFAVITFVFVWRAVHGRGESLCSAGSPPDWQAYWLPVQVVAALVSLALIFSNWKNKSSGNAGT